jgi:hypothetical protein
VVGGECLGHDEPAVGFAGIEDVLLDAERAVDRSPSTGH